MRHWSKIRVEGGDRDMAAGSITEFEEERKGKTDSYGEKYVT